MWGFIMRSLKATTELSGEIRNARNLNETLKLEDENCNLKEKVNNQSYLISELLETITVEISKPRSKPFIVNCMYRRPNSTDELYSVHMKN